MTDNERLTNQSVDAFIRATAAKVHVPGGGSVAGVVGALGTALGEMALAYTRGKKAFAAHEDDYERIEARLAKVRGLFVDLIAEDIAAFDLYTQASSTEGADKDEAVQAALTACIDVPREMTKLALAVLVDIESLLGRCTKWLISDLGAAAVLAETVVTLSDYNVRVNVTAVADQDAAQQVLQSSGADCVKAAGIAERIDAETKRCLTPS